MPGSHILHAYRFPKDKKAKEISEKTLHKDVLSKTLSWVHIDSQDEEAKSWLEQEVSFLDPFVSEALLADETRPRVTQINDGLLLILRGVNLNQNANPEDMVSIRLWIDPHRIISVQRRQLKAVLDIEKQIKSGLQVEDAGAFLSLLLEKLFNRLGPVLSGLDEDTDEIEEKIIENPDHLLRENVLRIRKKAIMFRRYMLPQKDVINFLKNTDLPWLMPKYRRSLQENFDRIVRYVEDLDAIRERAQIINDELGNILSDRLNKNMYILSVIAAIFLPLGFLTGLLGINVGGIPGAENPYAFYVFIGFLLILGIAQIVIFKKKKWF